MTTSQKSIETTNFAETTPTVSGAADDLLAELGDAAAAASAINYILNYIVRIRNNF